MLVHILVIETFKAMLPEPYFSDITRGRWAGFTPKEQEWTHPITTPSLFGTSAARWWHSTTRRWVEMDTHCTDSYLKYHKCVELQEMMQPLTVSFKSPLGPDARDFIFKPELLFFTTAGQCCTSLCCTGLCCALHPQPLTAAPLCWREGAWMGLFVPIFRFPHAAEHGPVWIQWQNGLPAQAWCSASQWQEVWPFLWQDWHCCGKHVDHKGRFSALL